MLLILPALLVAVVCGAVIARALLLTRLVREWQRGRFIPLVLTRRPVPTDGDELLLALGTRAWAPFVAGQRATAEGARPRVRLGATTLARTDGRLVRWRGPHVDVGRGAFAITSRRVLFSRGTTRHEFPLRADVRWQVHNGRLEARDARATLLASYELPAPTQFVKLIAAARGKATAVVAGLLLLPLALPRAVAAQQGAAAPLPATVEVRAMDFAFHAPSRVAAGLVTVSLRNTGKKLHHLQLFRLEEGKRLADLYPLLVRAKSVANPPAWAIPAGGPSAALPGATIATRQRLAPGRYALICWVPAPDGQPHFMKGMISELEVVGPAEGNGRAEEPRADVRATLREYTVRLDGPLAAGRRRIRVENTGTQPHELLLVRLAPGKTLDDVAHWSERGQEGPSPALAWHGVAAIAPRGVAYVDVELTAGEWAVFCLSPDRGDGRPHLLHGMRRTFTVR